MFLFKAPFIILAGLAFYDELNRPLLLEDAQVVYQYVSKMAEELLPGIESSMIGGFRR